MRKQLREVRRGESRQACPLATEGGLGALHGSLCFGERHGGAGRRPPAVNILPSSSQRLFRPLACIIERAQLLGVAQRASLEGMHADLLALRPPAWHKRHPLVQNGQQLRVEVLEAEPARERRSERVRRVGSCCVGEPRRLLLQPTTLRLGARFGVERQRCIELCDVGHPHLVARQCGGLQGLAEVLEAGRAANRLLRVGEGGAGGLDLLLRIDPVLYGVVER